MNVSCMKAASVSLTRVLANLLESMPPLRLYAIVACWANCVESVSIISATRWDCRSTGQENFLEIWESTLTTTLLSSILLQIFRTFLIKPGQQRSSSFSQKFVGKLFVDLVWPPSVFLSCANRTCCCLDQRVLQQQPTSLCYFQQNLLVQQQQQSPGEALT